MIRTLVIAGFLLLPGAAMAAKGSVTLTSVEGAVGVRKARAKGYVKADVGAQVAHGSRLRCGKTGRATMRFPDGTTSKLEPNSEIIVRIGAPKGKEPNGAVLFFGRLWSKVAKAVGGNESFEVRSANAVAGVRGTEFEIGVADDGSARVIVREGRVGVGGDRGEQTVDISAGYEIESSGVGRLGSRKKAPADADWDGWFAARARQLEKQGLRVAKDLNGRLDRRRAKLQKLVDEQRRLREQIEALEARKRKGAQVDDQLRAKLARLERVTERLVDMRRRLQAAFGMFERWGAVARSGGMDGAEELGKMAENIAQIAADFADMIEEGTDMSEESMNEMLQDMGEGKSDRPKKSAGDELF